MKTLPLLAATALLALMAAPVVAQTMPMTPAPPDPAPAAVPATTQDATAPVVASITVGDTTVQTVSNGPVPDTPEMRAKYKPLSHAGQHTKPAGN